ncbi:MAG: PTS sugar transporter subunit IIA [Myxococcales bacterium]|nr:PTS sugar transporter subunit IIA [Myxococcales bacterium]
MTTTTRPSPIVQDFLASVVVVLVALPLSIGIAVACGLPAETGLLTGIVGGIVVGALAGSPLLVTGPAASLIVVVASLLERHGLAALGPVVMLAGIWQLLAGLAGLGQWFRAVAPAVITGMLIGIGVLIIGSQLHIAIDADPAGSFLDNMLALRHRVGEEGRGAAMVVGGATVGLIVVWDRFKPTRLKLIPGHLVALTVVTATVAIVEAPVRFLTVSARFLDQIRLVEVASLKKLLIPEIVGLSFVVAFVASAATLLTAAAIDQRQSHCRTDYNREMAAQGVGNLIAGFVGGLPMTGVIVRSSVNVDAGARSRWSTILHGVWLLAFVAVAPGLLERIPRASLGAILVYTGVKLVNVDDLRKLYERGRSELAIAVITLAGVVFVDLFEGILIGLFVATAKLVYNFTHLEVKTEVDPDGTHHLHLAGAATFVRLPLIAEALEAVPARAALHVHIRELDYIDHACLELLSHARRGEGSEGLHIAWEELRERYDRVTRSRRPLAPGPRSMLRVLWREWRRRYAPHTDRADEGLHDDWLPEQSIRLRLEATSLDDVLVAAARALAPVTGVTADGLLAALRIRSTDGCVALGDGLGIPHGSSDEVKHPVAALVTTSSPLRIGDDDIDVFFVLIGPIAEPRRHLVALAHIGRLSHDRASLDAVRGASDAAAARRLVARAERYFELNALEASPEAIDKLLAVVELEGDAEVEAALVELITEGTPGEIPRVADQDIPMTSIRQLLGIARNRRLVVFAIGRQDVDLIRGLLSESARSLAGASIRMHLLGAQAEGVESHA